MSCSCCCYVTPRGAGIRKRERLVREEEGPGGGQEEAIRRNMDISLLREHYRCTRETQRRHTQVLLFRTVSEELSGAASIIPVTQGLTSSWEPNSTSPPGIALDPDPTTYDPWHVHLGLHRRSCPMVRLTAPSPETTDTNCSSRRSSSSSEAASSQQEVDSTSDPPGLSRETSPCSSFNSIKEDFNTERSRGDPDTGSSERSRGDPDTGSSERSRGDSFSCSQMDPVQVSVSGSKEDHPDGSFSDSQEGSATGSDGSSTPVASITSSPNSLHEDLKENQSAGRMTGNGVLQSSSTSAWRGSRKFSAPALRFTTQQSIGGLGSSTGVHHYQNYHPFPNRKTHRISEAARRLGMYSSF